jgi:hypothetical protein
MRHRNESLRAVLRELDAAGIRHEIRTGGRHLRRQMAEAQRLANLAPGEWQLWIDEASGAEGRARARAGREDGRRRAATDHRPSSAWWHEEMHKAELIVFPRGKTKFIRPDSSIGKCPGHGIVLIGAGAVACEMLKASGLGMCWDRRELAGRAP